jgi:hypothetical protein
VRVRSVTPATVAGGDAQLALGLRETIAACVDSGLASIQAGAPWSGPMPPVVVAHVRHAASTDVTLTTALCGCVAGYTLAWSFLLDEAAHHDLPDEQRFGLLLEASTAIGSLLTGIQAEIADAYSSEIGRRARSTEQRRAEIVHKLLAHEHQDADELSELGYELEAWHLGVIATGAGAGNAVRALAAGLGCELLAVARGPETMWAWLGGRRRVAFADVERVLSSGDHSDVWMAIGEPARGPDGLRQTHREAGGALLVARCWPRKLTRYLDVAPDATALQDEALAASLIETYLSPLDGMRIGAQAARKTLRALMDTGHNVSSAASALRVDRSTVHRQRNEIERRLGFRLHEHQGEIELALRIEDLRERRDGDATGVASRLLNCNTLE